MSQLVPECRDDVSKTSSLPSPLVVGNPTSRAHRESETHARSADAEYGNPDVLL